MTWISGILVNGKTNTGGGSGDVTTEELNAALALKADQSALNALDAEVDTKASQSALNAGLARKANLSVVNTLNTEVHAVERDVDALENQAHLQHKIPIPNFSISGNGVHRVSFNIAVIRDFLENARAFGLLQLRLKYQASHAEGSYRTQLGPAAPHRLINSSGGIGNTNENTPNYASILLDDHSFDPNSDTIDFQITVTNTTTPSFTINFTDIEIDIILGYEATADQIRRLLSVSVQDLNNMFVGATILGDQLLLTTRAGGLVTLNLPSDSGSDVGVGAAFPSNPENNELFIFDAAADPITAVDTDGSTPKTSAQNLDLFRYNGTAWQYVGFIGDTTGDADGVLSAATLQSNSVLRLTLSTGEQFTVDLSNLLLSHLPVHQRTIGTQVSVVSNSVHNETIDDLEELQTFLSIHQRAYAFLSLKGTFERTGDTGTDGDITIEILDAGHGETVLATYQLTNVQGYATLEDAVETNYSLTATVRTLANPDLIIRVTTTNSPGASIWHLSALDLDIVAAFDSLASVADGVVTAASIHGTTLTLQRSNSLPAITIDLNDLIEDLDTRVENLENNVSQRHHYHHRDFILTRDPTREEEPFLVGFTIDVTQIRKFLQDDRTFATLDFNIDYQSSVVPDDGSITITVRPRGGEAFITDTFDLAMDTDEHTLQYVEELDASKLTSNTLDVRIEISPEAEQTGLTVTFNDFEASITNGYEPPNLGPDTVRVYTNDAGLDATGTFVQIDQPHRFSDFRWIVFEASHDDRERKYQWFDRVKFLQGASIGENDNGDLDMVIHTENFWMGIQAEGGTQYNRGFRIRAKTTPSTMQIFGVYGVY